MISVTINGTPHQFDTDDVVQCGDCQSGRIMSENGLLTDNPKQTDSEIESAVDGNICRSGTYQCIRAAIHDAAHSLA
jgi:isoquinoline 1-oxidoreductase alpha subunit